VVNLGLEAGDLYIEGLALLDELGIIVILEPDLIALVRQDGAIGFLVLPDIQRRAFLRFSMY
jgi:hypothetical protein